MKLLTLSFLFISLGFLSPLASAADVSEDRALFYETLKQPLVENLAIPKSPFFLTFKDNQISIYKDGALFSTYDGNTPRFYVKGKPIIDQWTLKNILFDSSSQAIYVHGHLPLYDWPILRMTQDSVTELYFGRNYTLWNMFVREDNNIYVERTPWARGDNLETVRIGTDDVVPNREN